MIDSQLVPRADHMSLLLGDGFEDIHSYRAAGATVGKGWFGNLIKSAGSVAKQVVGTAKDAIVDGGKAALQSGLQAGVQSLASGGDPRMALMSGLKSAQAAGIGAAARSLGGSGYRKRPRRPRF